MIRVLPVLHDEVVVKAKRLADLERRARAHDLYLAATKATRIRQDSILDSVRDGTAEDRYAVGWLDAMREFGEAVAAADRSAE